MKFKLSAIRSVEEGFVRLAKLSEATKEINGQELVIDFSGCNFFDANMAAALKVVLTRIEESDNSVVLINMADGVKKILRKNHFLCEYGMAQAYDTNHTTLPFKKFSLSELHLFAKYLDEHLDGKGIPKMTAELEKAFRKSIFELFENCVMHSRSNTGVFVCGQFFPQMHRLKITISDAGVGIRTNVRRKIPGISSVDAIKWAMQEGNTTKTGSQPGGFGLKLLQEFIELNGGKVQIASRQGFYEFVNGKPNFSKLDADLPGTTINIEIDTNDTATYGLGSEISPSDIF